MSKPYYVLERQAPYPIPEGVPCQQTLKQQRYDMDLVQRLRADDIAASRVPPQRQLSPKAPRRKNILLGRNLELCAPATWGLGLGAINIRNQRSELR